MTNSPAPPPAPSTTSLVARTPEDVLAVVPIVLGFVPEESVVMLTFGAERTFHARVDLPDHESEIPEMVSALLGTRAAPRRPTGGLRRLLRRS